MLVSVAAAPLAPSSVEWCGTVRLVRYVVDGDTVDVAAVGRFRLLGIDAPEIGGRFERPAPFAAEARAALESLVLHRWVRLECDGSTTDDYGRRLANLWLETGIFVNARIVSDGLARVSARRRLMRLDELRNAEDQARSRRKGMWGAWPVR